MSKIGIVGYGVVGKAVAATMAKYYQIFKYDVAKTLDSFDDLLSCEFIFVCVPTPFDFSNNKVDDSAIQLTLSNLDVKHYSGVVIIKSTIPPGYCDNYLETYKLSIVFNPEFLRESTTPNEDFRNQDTVVIGTNDKSIYGKIKLMYQKVLISEAEYFMVRPIDAEMIKTSQNTMLASRVAVANMIFDVCRENKVDYEIVKKIAFDRFEILGPYMTQVPGPDGSRGFGGKCLPKDIRAFSTISDSNLLSNIIEYNDSLREDIHKSIKNYRKNND